MRKLGWATAIYAALALVVGTAFAGSKVSIIATIDTTNHLAYGAIGSVRNSADTLSSIACYVYTPAQGKATGLCGVGDAQGNFVMCSTTDAGIIATIESIANDSLISFVYDATSGDCVDVQINSNSQFEPKAL